MTKLGQKLYFITFRIFCKCSKSAKLHFEPWIKRSSLKEVPENSLFSSRRQKNGIRSINSRYTLLPSLGVQLSGEVPFVISEWLVWELPPDNQRVSNSLFERSPIIIVVGWNLISSEIRPYFSSSIPVFPARLSFSYSPVPIISGLWGRHIKVDWTVFVSSIVPSISTNLHGSLFFHLVHSTVDTG